MANSKFLEEKLLELGNSLSSPPSTVNELYSLLDQIDTLLARVEQSPPSSTLTALKPIMKGLVVQELLRHPDMDVKAAVASCTSEITRITAPEAPYEDDIMKEIFQMIVGAFETLDDTSSRSFQKRVSVLETVAKVRSCVVMLDLECDALILEMFQHFLRTIREDHPKNVFSSMETIMSLVIEESEDISSDLLSCLLDTVKHDNKDVLLVARDLVEKVVANCADKIKPSLVELVRSTGAPLGKYGKVVASICQESSEAWDHNEAHGSGEVLADDSKLSERTVSDELPQASVKLDQEAGCPEDVDAAANTSPVPAISNGTIQMGSGDSMEQPSSPRQKSEHSRRRGQSKNALAGRGDADNLEPDTGKQDDIIDLKKAKGRKTNSSVPLTETLDHSRVVSDKDTPTVTSRRKGRAKETSSSSRNNDASAKEVEQTISFKHEVKKELQNPPASDNPTSIALPTPVESPMNLVRKRRGRQPAKERVAHAVADKPAPESGEKDLLTNIQTDAMKDDGSQRETEAVAADGALGTVVRESETKPQSNSGKKGRSKKKLVEQSSERKQKSGRKQQNEESTVGKDVAEKPSLKEMSSPSRSASEAPTGDPTHMNDSVKSKSRRNRARDKEHGTSSFSPRSTSEVPSGDRTHLEDSVKPKSRRKRARDKEHTYETPDRKNKLGDNLVGSKIKVWWPDDAKFYEGIVESFIAVSKKHKILYDDGEVEILMLKNERWEFVDSDPKKEESKHIGGNTSETPPKKKIKASSDASSKIKDSQSQLKSGTESSSQVAEKRKCGRPRKVSYDGSSPGSSMKAKGKASGELDAKTQKSRMDDGGPESEPEGETPGTSIKREEPDNELKDETPKADSGNSKGERKKPGRKPKKGRTPNSSNILKDDTPKGTSRSYGEGTSKSKESTPKSTSRPKDDATGKSHTPKTKSKTNSIPKTSGDSNKANGLSSKVKAEVRESTKAVGLDDGEAAIAGGSGSSKRKRNRRK